MNRFFGWFFDFSKDAKQVFVDALLVAVRAEMESEINRRFEAPEEKALAAAVAEMVLNKLQDKAKN